MGQVVAFMSVADRLKLVHCANGHEYQDLDAAVSADHHYPSCRECGSPVDAVFENDGKTRRPVPPVPVAPQSSSSKGGT